MAQKTNDKLVSNGDPDWHDTDEVKQSLPENNDEDVRPSAVDPERYQQLVADIREYVCLSPGEQAERRIAWWEERERVITLEGREPHLSETLDAVARHAERRVRESRMLDDVKDSFTEAIFALEEEVYRYHHCSSRPTVQALDDFRRRLQGLMARSFRHYRVI